MLNIRKWLVILLDLCLVFSIIPINIFGEETQETDNTNTELSQTVSEVTDETEDIDVLEIAPEEETDNEETQQQMDDNENIQEVIQNIEEEIFLLDEPEVQVNTFSDAFANEFASQLIAYGIATESNIKEFIAESESSHTLKVGSDSRILVLLSHMTQSAESNYCDWTIDFNNTGPLSLEVVLRKSDTSDELLYCGLGDDNFPFAGKFTGNLGGLTSSHTIFKSVSSELEINLNGSITTIGITWNGSKDNPVLANKVVAVNDNHFLNMPLTQSVTFSPYIGELTGYAGQLKIGTLNYSAVKYQDNEVLSGDLGLVCNHMEDGTSLYISQIITPENQIVDLRGSENVGVLVGQMDSGSTLTIGSDMSLNVKTQGSNAGGIVGYCDNGSILIEAGKNVTIDAEVTGKNSGAVVGKLNTQSGLFGGNGTLIINSLKIKGTDAGNVGGLYGECNVTGKFDPLSKITVNNVSESSEYEISGNGNCGGLFGTLNLYENGKVIIRGADQNNLKIKSTLKNAENSTTYGGVAGTVTGIRANALALGYCEVITTIDVGTNPSNYPKYLGGIIGKQIGATADTKSCNITINNPTTNNAKDYGFGGVTAYLDDNTLLISDTVKVSTDKYTNNLGGGGITGSTHKGSIVYLKSSLDLSKCQMSTNSTSGQIVGFQDCSLIYAPGVEISRLKDGTYNGMELDDIGNYGEIYRIQDFLTLDEASYAVTFPKLKLTDNEYIFDDPKDYACFALAWQSRGSFSTVSGINSTNWSTLKSSTITLEKEIDLRKCGIGGLSRDVYYTDDVFSGIINGKGNTLVLSIGEENQSNTAKVSKGDGRIYWHNATGLFAGLSSSSQVKNLTLNGNVRLSNNRSSTMYSGSLAAQVNGNSNENGNSMLDKVSTNIVYDVYANGSNVLYVGGLIGFISEGKTTIDISAETIIGTKISITYSGNGSSNHFGSAIGGIANTASTTITCNDITIGGEIVQTGTNNINNMYVGGLIGTILPAQNNAIRKIDISKLRINGFDIDGYAKDRMSGILGAVWADTDVTISSLSVTNSQLNSNGTAELGGLVYRASGKWTVSSVDLSGLTINASSSKALGLLVCHGEQYKDYINGSNQNVDGLYLEMTEHWIWNSDKGYNVPSNIAFNGGVFDEFVAYTAYASRSSDTPNYQITSNGSGIISLKTDNNTINMTEDDRNTYVNRTTVGQSKQTNLYSRYYYNLSSVIASCNGVNIDTAQELLIWSVYRYASVNLKKYFYFDNVSTTQIGGNDSGNRADFDMNGLSYYPINITNSDVTIRYADVKFYNNDIEKKEEGNKSTRGDSETHSQHYTMHCSLFLDFSADLQNAENNYENRTMKVNGVSFAGSIGAVNGGSGALLCGNVAGETREGNTVFYTVVLADQDKIEQAVSLNGITVAPTGDYTPVLINHIDSYAGLKGNYVITSDQQTTLAGSSLIGNVGGEGATGINVSFAGTIKLSETIVFSKATLFNSIRYSSGSATYNFYKSKDYDGNTNVHNATYGMELSTTVEFAGKQGCYYDGFGRGYYISSNKVFDSQNDFSTYLPYVAFSPATGDTKHPLSDGWHEIAVNVLSDDFIDGCGTYGHPYKVNGNLLKQAADYINNGVASNGWQVRISKDTNYHTESDVHDVILTYTEQGWKNDTLTYTDDYVRSYLQSAYYLITEDIELSNFSGVGTSTEWAFKGVIIGKKEDGSIPTITMSGGSQSFIKYSYGSVVKNLNVVLNRSLTINRPSWTRGIAEQAPNTFFGGVIGCVLGGDNIIENVYVGNDAVINLTLSGTNSHLIPIGGYIGVIVGGGVIFRGTYSNNTGVTGSNDQLYRNPIIGRVLDGFAFYEGTGNAPNNGDNNYTINKITPSTGSSTDLIWNGTSLTVNNAQGLLVLSAIVSSGAGSSVSYAYANGVARNAEYNHIGENLEPSDYSIALKDSGAVWANSQTPYLLHMYAGYDGNDSICSSSTTGINVTFAADVNFDMSGFNNGYRGLSARYVSNAAFSTNTTLTDKNIESSNVDASTVVMRVNTFNGNGDTVQNINMDVKEYNNDDFHIASMGGIFNIVWTSKQSGGGGAGSNFAQNLTLKNCNVSLKYVDSIGAEKNFADGNTLNDADGKYSVSVGGFIGMANDIDANSDSRKTVKHNYLFTNIRIQGTGDNKCTIYGPNGAGGLIGTTAMATTGIKNNIPAGITGYPGILLANRKWTLFGPNFLNCSFDNIEVSAGAAAGGLIGDAYASESTTVPGFSGLGISYSADYKCYASYTLTETTLIVGKNSTITARAKASIAGGLFGAAGMRVGVNDPDVANSNKTNLPISGTPQTLTLSGVDVKVSQIDYNGSNPDSGTNNAYAGGIIARIGSVNPVCFYDILISNCKISSKLATFYSKDNSASFVGGIVGSGYTNTTDIMQRCTLSGVTIEGVYAGGFLGRGLDGKGFELHMSDCKLSESTVTGQQGNTSYAGGIVGNAAGKYYLSNTLIKNVSITASTGAGQLFGYLNINEAGNDLYVQAAGISVFSDNASINFPVSYYGGRNRAFDYIGYIAYCDYLGNETTVDNFKSPFVISNPNYQLTDNKTLYGDAVGKIQNDNYLSVAARIWADNKDGATDKKNLVLYSDAKSIVNLEGKTDPEISTFNSIQNIGPDDLPVLTIKGGDASIIEDYLNVITNGGYSKAKNTANRLDLNVTVYAFEDGAFVLKNKSELENANAPASIYLDGNDIKVLGNSYDNTRNRFSLVEATFKTTVNGQQRTYTVSVPVVVIRELRYDFMATLTYGAEFQKTAYSTLRNHVLESAGNPITAYLSYSYNRERGVFVPYDWQSYIETGGNMLAIDKELNLANGLPKDTQLILVDCQNGNAAYQYKVGEGGIDSVRLSSFTSVSNGKALYSSMADILGVNVSTSVDGKFVKTLDEGEATVKLNGEYYRLYKEGEKADRFNLTVPELKGKELTENYYLLINIPKQSGTDYFLNGNIESELVWNMPNSGTQVHRYNNELIDNASNTESTYQIYSGYQQALESLTNAGGEPINLLDTSKKMQVAFKDTITFSSRQAYNPDDPLFAKFNVSLREFTNDSSSGKDLQFAVGTSGTAHFYIQDSSGKYYIYNGTAWSAVNEEREAASYEWISQGNNMELLLSRNGKEALDLAGVRQIIKDNDTLRKEIIITAKMDVQFNDQDVIDATVPASDKNGADVWAQLHYVAMLSAQESSLSYSNNRTPINDNAHYYRSVSYAAVLSLDAVLIDQLGVNPLQPVEDYMHIFNGKDAALIGLNADLDVKNLPDYENTLKNSKEIRFSLSLEKRNGGDDYVPVAVVDASQLIGFTWEDDNQDWSWSIPQSKYVENGQLKESDLYADGRFSFPIDAHVYVDPREFANYKIKLAVAFIGNNDNPMSVRVDHDEAYVVYTYACIKPTFYTFNSGN